MNRIEIVASKIEADRQRKEIRRNIQQYSHLLPTNAMTEQGVINTISLCNEAFDLDSLAFMMLVGKPDISCSRLVVNKQK